MMPRALSSNHRILLTGGCGFIGSHLVRHLLRTTEAHLVNVDAITYASDLSELKVDEATGRYELVRQDISNAHAMSEVFERFRPHLIIHLAAETHVDRSIDAPVPFVQSNVTGTATLLEQARRSFQQMDADDRAEFRFIHISTDEVFGSIDADQFADPGWSFNPSSPYAASKAAADHLVNSWRRTFALPCCIARLSNVYGPRQFPEKMIPLSIVRAWNQEPLAVYGQGLNSRDWIFVDDAVAGIEAVVQRGCDGKSYHLATQQLTTNVDLVHQLCEALELHRRTSNSTAESLDEHPSFSNLISFVDDRPGHDMRYALDNRETCRSLEWSPAVDLKSGLTRTIDWYDSHRSWWEAIIQTRYQLQRLGITQRLESSSESADS